MQTNDTELNWQNSPEATHVDVLFTAALNNLVAIGVLTDNNRTSAMSGINIIKTQAVSLEDYKHKISEYNDKIYVSVCKHLLKTNNAPILEDYLPLAPASFDINREYKDQTSMLGDAIALAIAENRDMAILKLLVKHGAKITTAHDEEQRYIAHLNNRYDIANFFGHYVPSNWIAPLKIQAAKLIALAFCKEYPVATIIKDLDLVAANDADELSAKRLNAVMASEQAHYAYLKKLVDPLFKGMSRVEIQGAEEELVTPTVLESEESSKELADPLFEGTRSVEAQDNKGEQVTQEVPESADQKVEERVADQTFLVIRPLLKISKFLYAVIKGDYELLRESVENDGINPAEVITQQGENALHLIIKNHLQNPEFKNLYQLLVWFSYDKKQMLLTHKNINGEQPCDLIQDVEHEKRLNPTTFTTFFTPQSAKDVPLDASALDKKRKREEQNVKATPKRQHKDDQQEEGPSIQGP